MLFEERHQTDLEPAAHKELWWDFLLRSGRPEEARIRRVLNEWFSRYPEEHRTQLSARLSGRDPDNANSSFFELYLHELFLRSGHIVTVEPASPDGSSSRPDFLLSDHEGHLLYVEAVCATDRSRRERGAESRMNEFYDAINDLDSPDFFVGLEVNGTPCTPVPRGRLISELRIFVCAQDYGNCLAFLENGGLAALPRGRFSHDGWDIDYFVVPKQDLRGTTGVRPLGLLMSGVQWVDTLSAARKAISGKVSQHGELGQPYLIAVNVGNPFFDFDNAVEVLFGQEEVRIVTYSDGTSVSTESRKPDGILCNRQGPQNTRVSAVLFVRQLMPWTVVAHQPLVIHNPWTRHPAAACLPRLRAHLPNEGGQLHERPGHSSARLFALWEGWPLVSNPASQE